MRILHAIHDFLPNHRAGSEIYAHELARAQLARGHEPHVLCAEYDGTRPHGSLEWRRIGDLPVTEIANNWAFSSFAETYASPRIDAQLDHVLRAVAPDIVHVHNLLNLSFHLPRIAASRGIPTVATLHDFTLVCPSGGQRVHQAEEHVCIDIDTDRCARCFPQSHFHAQMAFSRAGGGSSIVSGLARRVRAVAPSLFDRLGREVAAHSGAQITAADIDARLEAARRDVFDVIDLFVAPSRALASDFARFGLPPDRIVVSDYGFPPLDTAKVARPRDPRRLRIGFVGTLVWHKGAHVVIEAVRQLPRDRFELVVHGSLDTFPAYSTRLRESAKDLPVELRGGFDREDVGRIYAGMDVLVVASLWPENSPLVIHEAFQAGVPVVGARMGGIADLLRHGENGLLYDAFSPDDLAARLQSILDDPESLERMAARLPRVKTNDEDAAEWDARYEEVRRRRHG